MIDLNKLQAAAEAATPGPWRIEMDSEQDYEQGIPYSEWPQTLHGPKNSLPGEWATKIGATHQVDEINELTLPDATYIAAANPAVVLELVGSHRAALARIARVEALHAPVDIESSETICGHCSYRLPNGNYFGKVIEWPCEDVRALTEGEPDATTGI